MTITVGVDTYVTVADADDYFASTGFAAWEAKTAGEKEIALWLACDYIEAQYAGRWKGELRDTTQRLSWPRYGVSDDEGRMVGGQEYPLRLKQAQCYLAQKSLTETLMPDIEAGAAHLIEQTAGPVSQKWTQGRKPEKRFLYAERLLKPYLTGSQNAVHLIRG